ncbi:electron transfer flavoprotein subunit beta/FixA family protein [Psychromicrobium xiongbiense]|uniref:electron transfer flavoprotein subunit beta/FixA family protein n=1 Tax=Psychromicrobium xiongbiense TaxID=3051184 RepID=UPI0025536EF7|nr:electron transfer flavoprotein subunit beta/FixA family protein [Psychromicrobium sp. YIM S02556]
MSIAVLVKQVPDAQFDRHLRSRDVDSQDYRLDRQESILSELDEYPLEAALQIAEARGGEAAGNRVIAVTMGPEGAVSAVKKALQIGAYEGVHLSDEALAGSDAAGTSRALAALLSALGPLDLILTGMASTDGETSVIPAQLATRLGLPQLTFASSLELEGTTLKGRRDHADRSEQLEVTLPAVVSVTDQANHPRYPNFKGIMAAKKRTITSYDLAQLQLDPGQVGSAGALTSVVDASPRPARVAGTIITDEGDAGIRLVDFLAEQKLL